MTLHALASRWAAPLAQFGTTPLQDGAPPPPAPGHADRVLYYGTIGSIWAMLVSVAVVGGLVLVVRHLLQPATRTSRRLGRVLAWSNGALAVASFAFAAMDAVPGAWGRELAGIAIVVGLCHVGIAVANGWLARGPIADPAADGEDAGTS